MPFMTIIPAYTVAQNLGHVSHIVGALNAIGFLISAVFTTHKITDLVGVGCFIIAVVSLTTCCCLPTPRFTPHLSVYN